MPLWRKFKGIFLVLALVLVPGACIWAETTPQHSVSEPTQNETSTEAKPEDSPQQSSSQTPSQTPVAAVDRRAPEPPAPEIVDSLKQVQFARPTLEKIENVFGQQQVVDRQVFENVVSDLKQKDPNFTESQAQELRRLYDSKLGVIPPEKIGPQLSAAAKQLLEGNPQTVGAVGATGIPSPELDPNKGTENKEANALDSDFFSKALAQSEEKDSDETEQTGEEAEAKPKVDNKERSELLDALKLVLANKDKDKDKDDEADKPSDRGSESTPPLPPVANTGPDEEDSSDPLDEILNRQNQNQNGGGINPLALAALGQSKNSGSESDKSNKEEDDTPKSSPTKEKKNLVPPPEEKVSKLPEEKPEPEPLQPPAEDLLSAAQNLSNGVVPNKVPLPALPPPGAGAGGGFPLGLGQADMGMPGMGGAGMMGGMGAGMMGGGAMGGGLPSAFQGDPFGSVGMEPMTGGTGGFNYLRMAEFGSAGAGGESTAVAEGSGYGDGPMTKRPVGITDQIALDSTGGPSQSIVERYVGKVDQYVCNAPEAERVALCGRFNQQPASGNARY